VPPDLSVFARRAGGPRDRRGRRSACARRLTWSRVALAVALALCLTSPGRRAEAEPGIRRFALLVGNNDGGPGTRPLLYAREDAHKLHELLLRLGGVEPSDAMLLLDGNAGEVLSALSALSGRARAAGQSGQRTALVFYYSGHSKDGSLRLGGTTLPWQTLRSALEQAPVEVRIGIVDACQSGALTRTKGARKAPAFAVDAESPKEARGLVFLTASAANEDAQESDVIGGSYFSHHLASGLLGGADRSGDGRVTLFEAYAYAYERTVADTIDSSAGAQHPTFSYDLAGNGDLVLTDVVSRREGLLFTAEAPPGTYFLVDARGVVTAEVTKPVASARRVALAPGHYRVKRRLADRLRVGEVEVRPGEVGTLDEGRFRDVAFADDPVKGAAAEVGARWSLGVGGGWQTVYLAPSEGLFPSAGMVNVELGLRDFFRRGWVWGLDGGLAGARSAVAVSGNSRPFSFSELAVATSLGAEWHPWSSVTPFLGFRVAFLMFSRRFDEAALPPQYFATVSPGLVGGLSYALGAGLSVTARARLHYLVYNIDGNRSLGLSELGVFGVYDF